MVVSPDDDCRVIDVVEPEVSTPIMKLAQGSGPSTLEKIGHLNEQIDLIAIGRAPTKPASYGAILISFADGEGIAQFADLISRLARLGKTVRLSIEVVDE